MDTGGCLADFNQLSCEMLEAAGPAPYAPRNGFCGNSMDFMLRECAGGVMVVVLLVLVLVLVLVVLLVVLVVLLLVVLVLVLVLVLARPAELDRFCDGDDVEGVGCTRRFERVLQPDDPSKDE